MQEMEYQTPNVVYANHAATEYTFYLDSDIGEPSEYHGLFQVLQNATENDVVKIFINSNGGYLHTSIQICSMIKGSAATVVGIIQGMAYSGAGLVLLACDIVEVAPHSTFMAHTSIGGSGWEKMSDTTRSLEHSNKQLEKFYRDTFRGFFTEDEVTEILEGKDYWLIDEEIHERLSARAEMMEEEYRQMLSEAEGPSKEDLKKLTKDKLIGLILGEE